MVCIHCGEKTRITNSRSSEKTISTWRRRHCDHCQATFTTRETIDYTSALRVKTRSGVLEPFLRDKLLISIHSSLSHRKNPCEDAESLTATVITSLLNTHTRGIVAVTEIAQTIEPVLSRFDKPAATYYQAHHL